MRIAACLLCMGRLTICAFSALVLFVQIGCFNEEDSSPPKTVSYHDSNTTLELEQPATISHFIAFPIKNLKTFGTLADSLGYDRMHLILKINRRDTRHIHQNDTLMIPQVFDEEQLAPFPLYLESIKDIPKIILVSRTVQALGAYSNGRLIRWTGISTGKKSTQTPAGLFHVNWKKELKISSVDSTWIMPWCVNIESKLGVNIHAYGLPGYPASHSCVRLPLDEAKWIYDWVDTWNHAEGKTIPGTPVIIFGQYAFGTRPPWKQLDKDPRAHFVNTLELQYAINARKTTLYAFAHPADSSEMVQASM